MKNADSRCPFRPPLRRASAAFPPDHAPTTMMIVGGGMVRREEGWGSESRKKEEKELGKKGQVVRLSNLNLEVLSVLEKWGILNLGQLDGGVFHKELTDERKVELFFRPTLRKDFDGTAYKGISRLEKSGYVKGVLFTNLDRVYRLTASGHQILKDKGLNRLPVLSGETAEPLVRHELLVSAIGLTLSVVRGLRVRTEWERYLGSSEGQKKTGRKDFGLSDLWISDETQPKAVEVERTQKSARRYEELWRNYREDLPPGGVVLYVVCFPGGLSLLKRAEKLGADHVYFCSLSDFKASLGRGPFVGYRGGQIWLGADVVARGGLS